LCASFSFRLVEDAGEACQTDRFVCQNSNPNWFRSAIQRHVSGRVSRPGKTETHLTERCKNRQHLTIDQLALCSQRCALSANGLLQVIKGGYAASGMERRRLRHNWEPVPPTAEEQSQSWARLALREFSEPTPYRRLEGELGPLCWPFSSWRYLPTEMEIFGAVQRRLVPGAKRRSQTAGNWGWRKLRDREQERDLDFHSCRLRV
jgi:hypothetical protein